MTSRDIMPFGKFGKAKCGELAKTVGWLKENEPDYVQWLVTQEGFAQKNAALYKFFTEGETASSTPAERQVNLDESPLMDPMPAAFKTFWKLSYGERMRVHGQLQYTAFLRVACTTWKACADACLTEPQQSVSVPDANQSRMLPPPLSHIPAPNLPGMLKADLSKQFTDGRDEEVNF